VALELNCKDEMMLTHKVGEKEDVLELPLLHDVLPFEHGLLPSHYSCLSESQSFYCHP
jgi:hypothetical protein